MKLTVLKYLSHYFISFLILQLATAEHECKPTHGIAMLFNSLAQSLIKMRPTLVCHPLLDSHIDTRIRRRYIEWGSNSRNSLRS